MITVTEVAARQIIAAAEQGKMDHLSLRVAARRAPDGSIEYGMGFDEASEEDLTFDCAGIEVICQPQFEGLLKGATLDFVELEPGDYRFIFMNPNDPHHHAHGEGGCGSGGGCACSSSEEASKAPTGPSSGGCGCGGGCSSR